MQKIGPIAYQLELPPGSRIHPVFHCSLLKPFQPLTDQTNPIAELPTTSVDNDPIISPLVILDTKWDQSDNGPKLMVLVQWKGLFPEDASWEPWESLKADFHLEDKVFFDGHGNVMNETEQQQQTNNIDRAIQQADTGETITNQRPKRRIIKPQYLKDFA